VSSAIPRIFGRAFEQVWPGLKIAQLEQRLNDAAMRPALQTQPGEFSVGSGIVVLRTSGAFTHHPRRVLQGRDNGDQQAGESGDGKPCRSRRSKR
jgi:hypothetical protein